MMVIRSFAATALPLLALLAIGCAPSSTSSGEDLGVESGADLSRRPGDLSASPSDLASGPTDLTPSSIGSCLPLNTYCGYGGNFCVSTWANAQIPANWCVPGKDVNIYVPTGPCTDGYRVIILGGANFYDNKHLFYAQDGDGALVAVVSVGEGGSYLCDAGDASYAALMYNGCSYTTAAECVNGIIQ